MNIAENDGLNARSSGKASSRDTIALGKLLEICFQPACHLDNNLQQNHPIRMQNGHTAEVSPCSRQESHGMIAGSRDLWPTGRTITSPNGLACRPQTKRESISGLFYRSVAVLF
jgi:hypothetical protein